MSKNILILGGGVGGIITANKLRKFLNSEHNISVIEKNHVHSFAPSFLWLMTGLRKPEEISVDTAKLLHKGIELINDEVTEILTNSCKVETSTDSFDYDYLVIALGAETAPENIPGLSSDYNTFYTYSGAEALHHALKNFIGGNIAVVIASLPYKCPAAPYEGAMLIGDFLSDKGTRQKAEINLYTPEPYPMPVAGPSAGNSIIEILKSRNIGFHPLQKLKYIDAPSKTLFFGEKESVVYDLLVTIPPHQSPKVVRNSGLASPAGWIPVNPETLQSSIPNIYAIGDVSSVPIKGRWNKDIPLMLPKAGIFAHIEAEIVAKNISDEINNRTPLKKFSGKGFCMLEAGEDVAGFAHGNFFAEPSPEVILHKTGKLWHIGKILFEKWWLAPYGFKKSCLRFILNTGCLFLKIPVKL